MQEILRSEIGSMPASDYVAARKFIDAIEYAAVASSRSQKTSEHLARRVP